MTDWIRSGHGSIEGIAIAEIILDDDLQPRCGIDAVLVGEYADVLAGGATLHEAQVSHALATSE